MDMQCTMGKGGKAMARERERNAPGKTGKKEGKKKSHCLEAFLCAGQLLGDSQVGTREY